MTNDETGLCHLQAYVFDRLITKANAYSYTVNAVHTNK